MQMEQNNLFKFSPKRCLVCRKPRDSVYYNVSDSGEVWVYCCACGRSYNAREYCELGGITYTELLLSGIQFNDKKANEVNRLDWPSYFISLLDVKAKAGRDYLESRGLSIEGEIYYDSKRNGIVFPMYFDMYFCGAQIRLINPRPGEDGKDVKMISEPGTRTSILVYNWNQLPFLTDVKAIVITEGAINCLSLMQSMSLVYNNILSPYKFVSLSGSGASSHHLEKFKELVDSGYKVIVAADNDSAGEKMINKFVEHGALTHFSLPGRGDMDWNDILISGGKKDLLKCFFGGMVSYESIKNKNN